MNKSSARLLVLGASARAAAMSARLAGYRPWAADRFADLDLRHWAKILPVADYPAGLEEAVDTAPDGPWMYTGALENRPELIERLSAKGELLGIGGESLRAVRDPFRLAEAITAAGLSAPKCAASADRLPRDGTWLEKPLASAGGCGIRALGTGDWGLGPRDERVKPTTFFQPRIDGIPIGAVFVAANRRAELIGATRQLIGCAWCGLTRPADQFRYCGSIGPVSFDNTLAGELSRLGNALAAAFDLHGLFGVDAIITEQQEVQQEIDARGAVAGQLWPVEVNPRYTASVEVLERALGIRAIREHVAACRAGSTSALPSVQDLISRWQHCGKAILFAEEGSAVSAEFSRWCQQQNLNRPWPQIADIPRAKTIVGGGEPICTVLAHGQDEAAVMAKLKSLAGLAYRKIAKYGKCRQ